MDVELKALVLHSMSKVVERAAVSRLHQVQRARG